VESCFSMDKPMHLVSAHLIMESCSSMDEPMALV
jgi:hypothetical protein